MPSGLRAPDGTPYLINPACFAKPGRAGEIGNLQRNLLRNAPIFNTDLAFFKNFKLGEKREIQLRWEMYNLFNRANFTDINGALTFAPDTGNVKPTSGTCPAGQVLGYPGLCTSTTLGQVSQTSSTFGTPRTTRSPRVMQASIRINF